MNEFAIVPIIANRVIVPGEERRILADGTHEDIQIGPIELPGVLADTVATPLY
jgi:hypothetical protein